MAGAIYLADTSVYVFQRRHPVVRARFEAPLTEGRLAACQMTALAVHRELARRSQHRYFRLPDLIIAATAELSGATVLHHDADYDRIRAITGQPTEWAAPRGEL